jgi:hypothetical protein
MNTPRNTWLEYTDHSFNHLCPPNDQPRKQHFSETGVLRTRSSDHNQ